MTVEALAKSALRGGVTLTITASGDVGQGKSRALELVLDDLKKSEAVSCLKIEYLQVGRAEVVVVHLAVSEPWKSKR